MPEIHYSRGRKTPFLIISAFLGLILVAILVLQIPAVKDRLDWRIERAQAYLGGVVHPVKDLPTAQAVTGSADQAATATITPLPPTSTPTPAISPTPRSSPTALPASVKLEPPPYEVQDQNNCGPATLSMYLNYYGWQGDQFTISDVIKPIPQDRNVNIDELLFFTRNYAGWLGSEFRVGGTTTLLRQFLAAGIPVVIEEGFYLAESYWPNDDRWAGHYLLITGYDDATQTFVTQDTFLGKNRVVAYKDLDRSWQTFNRVYFLVFTADQKDQVASILGSDWDEKANRQHALDTARAETKNNPGNPYAWFNLGSNLVYFSSYSEAAAAYDTARQIGLPQRMLRYQFGPFFAYFNLNRNEDLLSLSDYALTITKNSEEALLWHGWALYRDGNKAGALQEFDKALQAHPDYTDAQYAITFVNEN